MPESLAVVAHPCAKQCDQHIRPLRQTLEILFFFSL
jgi:hypothetical protein